MGRASRWLRSLWGGGKKDKLCKDYSTGYLNNEERKDKKRWSFGKSSRDSRDVVFVQSSSSEAAVEAALFPSFYADTEKEQSKHAIAVAAATAAAADAAVAAAQAAVEVVRLTSQGRGAIIGGRGTGSFHEKFAAMKIQTAFRGFLAKKALRALKALVKLQALVRGYLVRRQAAATFHSMQALIRAQSAVRAQRSRSFAHSDRRIQTEIRSRRSLERFDENRSEQLMSIHSRRFSTSLDSTSGGFDRSPKIVEIDTIRPKSRSSRRTSSPSVVDSGEETHQNSLPSPLQNQILTRLSIPDSRNFEEYDWCLTSEKCRFSATAQSTPRYMNSCNNVTLTPAKSVCGAEGAFRNFLNVSNCPNYMSKTQSFEAKVRSQSAPKQRPEQARMRKRLPLSEVVIESRASISAIGIQRPNPQLQEPFNFNSAIIGRIDRSSELLGRDFYLDRKW